MGIKKTTDIFGKKIRISNSIANTMVNVFGLNAVNTSSTNYSIEIPLFSAEQYNQYKEHIHDLVSQSKGLISPRIYVPKEHALVANKYVYDYVQHKILTAGQRTLTKNDVSSFAKPFNVRIATLPTYNSSSKVYTSDVDKLLLYAGQSGVSLVRKEHNVYGAVAALEGFQVIHQSNIDGVPLSSAEIIPLSSNVNARLQSERSKNVYPFFNIYYAGQRADQKYVKQVQEQLDVIANSYSGKASAEQLSAAKSNINELIESGKIHKFSIDIAEWSKLKRKALSNANYDTTSFLGLQLSRATAATRSAKWMRARDVFEQLKQYKPSASTIAFDIETLSTGSMLQVGTSKAGQMKSMLPNMYKNSELFAPPPLETPGYLSVLEQAITNGPDSDINDVKQLFKTIYSDISAGNTKLLGYNVLGFDFEQLTKSGVLEESEADFFKKNVVDVYPLIQKYAPVIENVYNTKFRNLRLTTIAEALEVANAKEISERAHSADYDAWLTEQVYNKIAFVDAFEHNKLPVNLPKSVLEYERKYSDAYSALDKADSSSMSYKNLMKLIDDITYKRKPNGYKQSKSEGYKQLTLLDISRYKKRLSGHLTQSKHGKVNINGTMFNLHFERDKNKVINTTGTLSLNGKTIGKEVNMSLENGSTDIYETLLSNATAKMKTRIKKSLDTGDTEALEQSLSDLLMKKSLPLVASAETNTSKFYSSVSNMFYNTDIPENILDLKIGMQKQKEIIFDDTYNDINNSIEDINNFDKMFSNVLKDKRVIKKLSKSELDILKFADYSSATLEDEPEILDGSVLNSTAGVQKQISNALSKLLRIARGNKHDSVNQTVLDDFNMIVGKYNLSEKDIPLIMSLNGKLKNFGKTQMNDLLHAIHFISKEIVGQDQENISTLSELGLTDKEIGMLLKIPLDIISKSNRVTSELATEPITFELKYSNPAVLGGLPEETLHEIKDNFVRMTDKYTGNASRGDLQLLYSEYIRNVRGFAMANSMLEMKHTNPVEALKMYKPGSRPLKKVLGLAARYTKTNESDKFETFRDYLQATVEDRIGIAFDKASERRGNTLAEFIKELNSDGIFNIFDKKLTLDEKLAFAMYYVQRPKYSELYAYKDTISNEFAEAIFSGEATEGMAANEASDIEKIASSNTSDATSIDAISNEEAYNYASKYKPIDRIVDEIAGHATPVSIAEAFEKQVPFIREQLQNAKTVEEKFTIIEAAKQYLKEFSDIHNFSGNKKEQEALRKIFGFLHKEAKKAIYQNKHLYTPTFVYANIDVLNKIGFSRNNSEKRLKTAYTELKVAISKLDLNTGTPEERQRYADKLAEYIQTFKIGIQGSKEIDPFIKKEYIAKLEMDASRVNNTSIYVVSATNVAKRDISNSIFDKMNKMSKGEKAKLNSDELLILKALTGEDTKLNINGKTYKIGNPITIKTHDERFRGTDHITSAIPLIDESGNVVFMGSGKNIISIAGVKEKDLASISAQLYKQSDVTTEEAEFTTDKMPKLFKEAFVNIRNKKIKELEERNLKLEETNKRLLDLQKHIDSAENKIDSISDMIIQNKEAATIREVKSRNEKLSAAVEAKKQEIIDEAKQVSEENDVDTIKQVIQQYTEKQNSKGKEKATNSILKNIKKASTESRNYISNIKSSIKKIIENPESIEVTPEELSYEIQKSIKGKADNASTKISKGVEYYSQEAEKLISKQSLKNASEGIEKAAANLFKSKRFWKGAAIVAAISGGLYALSYTATKGTSKEDIQKAAKTQVLNNTRYNSSLMRDFSFVMTPYGVDINYYADSDNQVNYPTEYMNALNLDRTSVRR